MPAGIGPAANNDFHIILGEHGVFVARPCRERGQRINVRLLRLDLHPHIPPRKSVQKLLVGLAQMALLSAYALDIFLELSAVLVVRGGNDNVLVEFAELFLVCRYLANGSSHTLIIPRHLRSGKSFCQAVGLAEFSQAALRRFHLERKFGRYRLPCCMERDSLGTVLPHLPFQRPLLLGQKIRLVVLFKLGAGERSVTGNGYPVNEGFRLMPAVDAEYAGGLVVARLSDGVDDLRSCAYGTHACNLGGILAFELGGEFGKPAFTVDPPVIDEITDVARLSGHRDYPRRPLFHALNARAIARHYAADHGLRYETLRLIVAHMGGGVTVSAHLNGRIVDVNNGLEGEGPYSAERPGALPVLPVAQAIYEGKYGDTYEAFRRFFTSRCGLVSYQGTNDGREVSRRVQEGDKEAELAYRGMAYQIAKEIGAMGAVLSGDVDAVLLTGGFAFDELFTGWIREYVGFLAPVFIYPGEDEMRSLAHGALRVLRGEEEALEYS